MLSCGGAGGNRVFALSASSRPSRRAKKKMFSRAQAKTPIVQTQVVPVANRRRWAGDSIGNVLRAALVWLLALALCAFVVPGRLLPRELAPDDSGTVRLATLPPEARVTVELILSGGPFPYRKDGSVFSNRERRLPRRSYGYYHEYTVPTPGSRDRGARRIISGQPGELYYTYDHYRHLQRIIE